MRASLLRCSALAIAAAFVVGASDGTPAAAAGKQYTIGLSVATLANPFFQGMTKGVVDAVKANPQLALVNTSAQGDANTQASQVQDLINRKVDALIINPINAQAIVPIVKQANKAGIPVFTLDRGAGLRTVSSQLSRNEQHPARKRGRRFYRSRDEKALRLGKRQRRRPDRLDRHDGGRRS